MGLKKNILLIMLINGIILTSLYSIDFNIIGTYKIKEKKDERCPDKIYVKEGYGGCYSIEGFYKDSSREQFMMYNLKNNELLSCSWAPSADFKIDKLRQTMESQNFLPNCIFQKE